MAARKRGEKIKERLKSIGSVRHWKGEYVQHVRASAQAVNYDAGDGAMIEVELFDYISRLIDRLVADGRTRLKLPIKTDLFNLINW